MTWQPIETAPKDNHFILAWCPERKNIYAATWSQNGYWLVFGGYAITEEVTHWMPMPQPPEEKP